MASTQPPDGGGGDGPGENLGEVASNLQTVRIYLNLFYLFCFSVFFHVDLTYLMQIGKRKKYLLKFF